MLACNSTEDCCRVRVDIVWLLSMQTYNQSHQMTGDLPNDEEYPVNEMNKD